MTWHSVNKGRVSSFNYLELEHPYAWQEKKRVYTQTHTIQQNY